MDIKTNQTIIGLWEETLKSGEEKCLITLGDELKVYLISLLMRYTDRPDIAHHVFAKSFLEATKAKQTQRIQSLQHVGDLCLLHAGLFPKLAEKRHVKISYFVDLGRSAYAGIAKNAKDFFWLLASQFVAMMDVLQSIRFQHEMLPLEAYEQWDEVGSQYAYKILQLYGDGLPFKK